MNAGRDLPVLKAAVSEGQKVIKRAAGNSLFVTGMKKVEQDWWEHGRKGILEEAVQRKRVQKPKLVIDPEDRIVL